MDERYWLAHRTAETRTSRAWIVALTHAAIYLVLGAMGAMAGTLRDWTDAIPLGYGVLLASLAVAVGRHSRIAAGLLLALTLWIEGGAAIERHSLISLAMFGLFAPIYAFALAGATSWHRLERARVETAPVAPVT